ncbi:hypothetical protein DQ04_11191020 [Trypanosoma grayi]|uniref:hypothetical protein n=1 Tax=Trypanosoma grayi TaxID=71804 RepID=UPI0004F4508D|nr:hypothetical protein DQ04_11191020 [Trypanosoma grayi]KEG07029.1 hypothetical protein DQ04_11191020 [Trypanosoma grayi]
MPERGGEGTLAEPTPNKGHAKHHITPSPFFFFRCFVVAVIVVVPLSNAAREALSWQKPRRLQPQGATPGPFNAYQGRVGHCGMGAPQQSAQESRPSPAMGKLALCGRSSCRFYLSLPAGRLRHPGGH